MSVAGVGRAGALGVFLLAGTARPAAAQGPIDVKTGPGANVSDGGTGEQFPLRETADGRGWRYDGRNFSAFIARDGSVQFTNHRISSRPSGLIQTTREKKYVAMSAMDAVRPTPDTEPTLPLYSSTPLPSRPSDLPGFARDRMGVPEPPSQRNPPLQPSLGGAGGRADMTDVILDHLGQDPYRDRKAALLRETFEWRLKMANEAHDATMKRALQNLSDTLNRLDADPRLSPGERRAILQALNAEMDDTPDGQHARALVDAHLRALTASE
jgi:hypothetical protein